MTGFAGPLFVWSGGASLHLSLKREQMVGATTDKPSLR